MTIAARAHIAETGICKARPAEPIRCGRTAKLPQIAVEKPIWTVDTPDIAVEKLSATVEIPHIAVEIPAAMVEIIHIAVENLSATVDILRIAVENPAAQALGWARSMKMCPGRSVWTRRMCVRIRPPQPADSRSIRSLTRKCTQIPR